MTLTGLSIEDRGAIVHVVGTGLYDAAIVKAHALALRSALSDRRGRRQPVRVLVDLTASIVQRPEIARLLADEMRSIYEAGDRVVLLCPSALHAMQIRRANSGHDRYVTASREKADRFLATGEKPA